MTTESKKTWVIQQFDWPEPKVISPKFASPEEAIEWGNKHLQASWRVLDYSVKEVTC